MGAENGEWIIHGLEWDNPLRIRSAQELVNYVNEVGFLPLFKNEIDGFSAEEHTWSNGWWSGDPEQDPWEWREEIARSGKVAYGKFFDKNAWEAECLWIKQFAPRHFALNGNVSQVRHFLISYFLLHLLPLSCKA